ncbi:unnamed protein product, partial [Mesorhabditis spiculigera]
MFAVEHAIRNWSMNYLEDGWLLPEGFRNDNSEQRRLGLYNSSAVACQDGAITLEICRNRKAGEKGKGGRLERHDHEPDEEPLHAEDVDDQDHLRKKLKDRWIMKIVIRLAWAQWTKTVMSV